MTTLSEHHKIAGLEADACAAAMAVGLIAKRAHLLLTTGDGPDGFLIYDPKGQCTLAGEGYKMSAEEVIAYCERLRRPI